MRTIRDEAAVRGEVEEAKREAKAAFGKDEMYFEKLVERARHVEVQLIGDSHGNLVHLFERDCSVQRRNQKVVERAPAPYLSDDVRDALTSAAIKLGNSTGYRGAGTVEFLMDADIFINLQIGLNRPQTLSDQVRLVSFKSMQRQFIFFGKNRNGSNVHFIGRAEHANSNFTSVGNEDFFDLHGRGRSYTFEYYSRNNGTVGMRQILIYSAG